MTVVSADSRVLRHALGNMPSVIGYGVKSNLDKAHLGVDWQPIHAALHQQICEQVHKAPTPFGGRYPRLCRQSLRDESVLS